MLLQNVNYQLANRSVNCVDLFEVKLIVNALSWNLLRRSLRPRVHSESFINCIPVGITIYSTAASKR